ncbi:MAG: cation diffusion facilitator family transporter [Gemmatimonadaceae bacterium]
MTQPHAGGSGGNLLTNPSPDTKPDPHNHRPGESHNHGAGASRRRLATVLVLVSFYMVAEAVGGWLTNSLALMADAGHMLSDAGALALSLFAVWIAQRPATSRRTYGYHRTEILAALVNGATLVAISLLIFVQAYHRFSRPPEVQGGLMIWIAVGGLLVNMLGLWILNSQRHESLNVRGAWLHVLTDAIGSVGAMIGGTLIWIYGWNWVDPLISVLIGILVIYSSWALLRETVAILMEEAPGNIDVEVVRASMSRVGGITDVHDLHVWSITSGMVALSAHVKSDDVEPAAVLLALRNVLNDDFGIGHITIQIDPPGHDDSGCFACHTTADVYATPLK